jgi:hypothetical protein
MILSIGWNSDKLLLIHVVRKKIKEKDLVYEAEVLLELWYDVVSNVWHILHNTLTNYTNKKVNNIRTSDYNKELVTIRSQHTNWYNKPKKRIIN